VREDEKRKCERERVCVYRCMCESSRERESVCVGERVRESVWESSRERERVRELKCARETQREFLVSRDLSECSMQVAQCPVPSDAPREHGKRRSGILFTTLFSLVSLFEEDPEFDLSDVVTFNLDEYLDLPREVCTANCRR
jgi:hypothetical protein